MSSRVLRRVHMALSPSCALTIVALLACCGSTVGGEPSRDGADRGPSSGSTTELVPPTVRLCTGADAAAELLLTFSLDGTHGLTCHESFAIACDGSVRVDALRACSSLRDRPGVHHARLDAARMAQVRTLAGRLVAPVPMPSLPPQGAELFVTVHATPPVSRPLRPAQASADGEAAALFTELLAQVEASAPSVILSVELRPAPVPLRAGQVGHLVVFAQNPGPRPVFVLEAPTLRIRSADRDETWFPGPTQRPEQMWMKPDASLWSGGQLGPNERIVAGFSITPPRSGAVTLIAEVTATIGLAAPTEAADRVFVSPPLAYEIAP